MPATSSKIKRLKRKVKKAKRKAERADRRVLSVRMDLLEEEMKQLARKHAKHSEFISRNNEAFAKQYEVLGQSMKERRPFTATELRDRTGSARSLTVITGNEVVPFVAPGAARGV